MMKTMFNVLFASVLLMVIVSSCLKPDEPGRTAATEQEELNKAITNLTAKGYNVDTTALGVYYITDKKGTGPLVQTGDTCHLIYTGFFLDGIIFDASYYHATDSIMKLVYKVDQVIPGFNDAVALMNKGAIINAIIPSELAYGANGNYTIPPYTPLVFNLKLKDLKPKK